MNQPSPDNKPFTGNCLSCPSFLDREKATVYLGKDIGVGICGRFGKPIGSAKSSDKQVKDIGTAIAKSCSKYGEGINLPQRVANWSAMDLRVTLPDPNQMGNNRRAQQDLVRSCNTCEHFVREDVVARELGWPTGLCSVKGKLLLSTRYAAEAQAPCPDRSVALSGVRTTTDGLMMLPEYAADFTLSTDPVKYHQQQKQLGIPEPQDYPTDQEVTAEQEASGIRAWRRITDPLTGNEVFLPIYRYDYFSEDEQKKIPKAGDDEHPEDYIDHGFYTYKVAVLWGELDETPAFWGAAGTGKTEFFRHMAYLMSLPFERISITASTEVEDLAGKMLYDPAQGTYWQDGRLISAWSKPCVMVVDEPNVAADPAVFHLLRPMFDNSKQLVIDANKGERRDRHDDCYIGVACNPAWDPKNVGTHVVSDADANRLMHISVPMPPPQLEREIIKKRCAHDDYEIPEETLDTILKIAKDIRDLCEEDTLPITWGVRPQLKVARASKWFDLKSCYRMASADFLDPEQQQALLDVVDSHVA